MWTVMALASLPVRIMLPRPQVQNPGFDECLTPLPELIPLVGFEQVVEGFGPVIDQVSYPIRGVFRQLSRAFGQRWAARG